jgi:hypothetical protein
MLHGGSFMVLPRLPAINVSGLQPSPFLLQDSRNLIEIQDLLAVN